MMKKIKGKICCFAQRAEGMHLSRYSNCLFLFLLIGVIPVLIPKLAFGLSQTLRADFAEILGSVNNEVCSQSLRCEWVGSEFLHLDRDHSTHRKNIKSYHVLVRGREIEESRNGLIEEIVYERYTHGPQRVAIVTGLASTPTSSIGGVPNRRDGINITAMDVRIGAKIEIYFIDKQNIRHDTFCGYVVRKNNQRTGNTIYAYQPRFNSESSIDRTFENMRASDIVSHVASHSLGLNAVTQATNEVIDIYRQTESNWALLRNLARENEYDIYLNDDKLYFWESDFSFPPDQRVQREWFKMRVSDVVSSIAGEHGWQSQVDSTKESHEKITQNNETDLDFLFRLGAEIGYSSYLDGNTFYFIPGQGMMIRPSIVSPNDNRTDLLLERVRVRWRKGFISYKRKYPRALFAETTLLLPGKRDPQHSPISATPIDLSTNHVTIKRLINNATNTLIRVAGNDSEAKFLKHIISVYQHSIVYHHCALVNGHAKLNALIGRN